MYNGQAEQDKFVLSVLKNKTDGVFIEIGSNDPVKINNTYILEKNYNWKGIMVEYGAQWLPEYKKHRKNSAHVINDATKVDYKTLFKYHNLPKNIDYLQLDLEANNGSTISTLKKLDSEIMDTYKFATITFEHDIYHCNHMNTRLESRAILEKRGYIMTFHDINNMGIDPFEDWYVHPDLVDMDYVNTLREKNAKHYKTDIKCDRYFNESPVKDSINWQDIEY